LRAGISKGYNQIRIPAASGPLESSWYQIRTINTLFLSSIPLDAGFVNVVLRYLAPLLPANAGRVAGWGISRHFVNFVYAKIIIQIIK